MKIVKSKIEWRIGWSNFPELHVWVDKAPKFSGPIYELDSVHLNQDGDYLNAMVWAEIDGIVDYLWMDLRQDSQITGPRGYGGKEFTRVLKNGKVLTSSNCWSGNTSGITKINACDVVLYDLSDEWPDPVGVSSAMIYPMARDLVRKHGAYLIPRDLSKSGFIHQFNVISAIPNRITKPTKQEQV